MEMDRINRVLSVLFVLGIMIPGGCRNRGTTETVVSIKGDKWFLNDKIINEGSPAEGLLMNVRMINSVFEDRGDKLPIEFSDFDPESNTNSFILFQRSLNIWRVVLMDSQ